MKLNTVGVAWSQYTEEQSGLEASQEAAEAATQCGLNERGESHAGLMQRGYNVMVRKG